MPTALHYYLGTCSKNIFKNKCRVTMLFYLWCRSNTFYKISRSFSSCS